MLNKQMKKKIDEELWEQKQSMLKWSAGMTGIFTVIYMAFFSRMPRFQRFFNNPESYMVTRGLKKTIAVYGLFLGCVASLSSNYEKGTP